MATRSGVTTFVAPKFAQMESGIPPSTAQNCLSRASVIFCAHRLKASITNVQLRLATRQGSFLMNWRVRNDSDLHMIAQIALVEAMPLAKKSMIECHVSFTAACGSVMHQYSLLRREDAVGIQCELVHIAQRSDESVISYVDGVESLWQELEGTSLTVPALHAVDHMRRGMSPDHGALFSSFMSTDAKSFKHIRRIVLLSIDARVSRNASGVADAAALRSQLQQLQLQHAQLQRLVHGSGCNHPSQDGNRTSQGGNCPYSPKSKTWWCRRCSANHPRAPNTCPRRRSIHSTVASTGARAPIGQFQHTIGNAGLSTVESSSSREKICVPPLDDRVSKKLCRVGGLVWTSQDRRNTSPFAKLAPWTAIFNRDGFTLPRSRLRGIRKRVIKRRVSTRDIKLKVVPLLVVNING